MNERVVHPSYRNRSRYIRINPGIALARNLPIELRYQIERRAGRAVHRARQSLVNAEVRRFRYEPDSRNPNRRQNPFYTSRRGVNRVRVYLRRTPVRIRGSSNVVQFYRRR